MVEVPEIGDLLVAKRTSTYYAPGTVGMVIKTEGGPEFVKSVTVRFYSGGCIEERVLGIYWNKRYDLKKVKHG